MKARFLILTLAPILLLPLSPISAQVNQGQGQSQSGNEEGEETEGQEELEGVEDEQNRKRRWQCSLPGGEYSVNLNSISSISKHSYVLDGTLLVTEVTIDTTGSALARFYYIEPITKDTNFNALARIQQRAKELQGRAQQRSGSATKIDEMAQKSYPTTTHARTIEFRIVNEIELNALYRSLFRAWDSGQGRTFRIQ